MLLTSARTTIGTDIRIKAYKKQQIVAVSASSMLGTDSGVGGVISGFFSRCVHKRGVER